MRVFGHGDRTKITIENAPTFPAFKVNYHFIPINPTRESEQRSK